MCLFCSGHKAQLDKSVGQELQIRNIKTNTVFDWSGGDRAKGIFHAWVAHGDKRFQMVRIGTHQQQPSLIIVLASGPLSVVAVATALNTQLQAPTLHLNGQSKTDICYILQWG
jgi:hypothetical protein